MVSYIKRKQTGFNIFFNKNYRVAKKKYFLVKIPPSKKE